MSLPDHLVARLKPGLMYRPAARDDAWAVYDPLSDANSGVTLGEPQPGELTPADLESDDRAWAGGRLQIDLYHQARTLRAHADGDEANLEINYLCGYACRHCFQTLVPARDAASTPDAGAIVAAADRVLASGCREVAITGGDVFLHPRIWEILDYVHERAPRTTVRVLVSGGGLAIRTPAVAARIAHLAGRRLVVKSDFFGHTAELHDAFTRVPGMVDRFEGALV